MGIVIKNNKASNVREKALDKRRGFQRKIKTIEDQLSFRLSQDTELLLGFITGRDPYNIDPLEIPAALAGNQAWDYLRNPPGYLINTFPKLKDLDFDRVLAGMARHSVKRAYSQMPIYEMVFGKDRIDELLKDIDSFLSIEDLFSYLPPLWKDGIDMLGISSKGFREIAVDDTSVLVPKVLEDILRLTGEETLVFPSGGSGGKSTYTTLTPRDVMAESYALAKRCLLRLGFYSGANFLSLYNSKHKGGMCLKIAARLLGLNQFDLNDVNNHLTIKHGDEWTTLFKELQNRQAYPEDVEKIGGYIAEFIEEHNINIIAAVQPPLEYISKNQKGNMLTFADIVYSRPEASKSVELVFLTGFRYPMYMKEYFDTLGIVGGTTWGSTESMANGTYILVPNSYPDTEEIWGNVNRLADISFPNVWEVMKLDPANNRWMPCDDGEPGWVMILNLYRQGTCYVNFPMDWGDRWVSDSSYGVVSIGKPPKATAIVGCAADVVYMGG